MFLPFLVISEAIIIIIFFGLAAVPVTGQPTYNYAICSDGTSNAANFQANLNALLGSLSSKAALNTSFYYQTSNQIYALYLCRGDDNSTACQNCVSTASQEIRLRCPSNRSAIIWYDECMLRYSDTNFFGQEDTHPLVFMWNTQNTTFPNQTDLDAMALIYGLAAKAPHSELMYVADESEAGNGSQKKYGLVQCTRDLSSENCSACLGALTEYIKSCCQGKIGWRILAPSCNLRCEQYPFFQLQRSAQPVPDDEGKGGKNTKKIVVIVLISAFSVTVIALLGFALCRRHRSGSREEVTEASEEILLSDLEGSTRRDFIGESIRGRYQDNSGEMQYFSLTTIQAATNNFSAANKLGQGGFGPVYKGKLSDGKEIAVKRLVRNSGQGLEEFKTEVMLIVKLQHKNLVRLLGCCIARGEKLLVYEYMANASLDAFLFDPTRSKQLDWAMRANIVNGIARGLLYLHEDSRLKIIHRDLKASNVLLDEEMNPKISDFGTARIFGGNQIEANTDRVVGTYGYMAPEYAMEGLFSVKSDVYSFGVLLLEILCGKKNSGFHHPEHDQSLLAYAWKLWNGGEELELIDQDLVNACPTNVALRWIHIALLCVQEDPKDRPSMSSVVLLLGSELPNLPKPSEPPFSVGRFFMSDQSSTSEAGIPVTDQSSTTASS